MVSMFRFKEIQQDPLDMKALKSSIDNDPIGLLKECRNYQGDWKTGTRHLNWQHWVGCYAGAQGIRQKPELFDKLLADDYFARRTYKADIKDILRLAFLIGTDADVKGATYKSACHIALHLQPLFDAEVEPEEVLKRIETAGGLKRLNVPEVAPETSKADAEDVGLRDDDDDGWDDWSAQPSDDHEDSDKEPAAPLTNARSPARSKPSGHRTMPSGSTKARGGQFRVKQATSPSKQVMKSSQNFAQEPGDGTFILEVEVTPEMLSRVLNSDLSFLCVKRFDLNESWYPVVCSRLDSLD